MPVRSQEASENLWAPHRGVQTYAAACGGGPHE